MQNYLFVAFSKSEPYHPPTIPPIGRGPRCHRAPKFSPVTTYLPKESIDPPNWNMKH